jgi:hypothetical protein
MRKLWLVPVLLLFFEVLAEARTWPQLVLGGGYQAVILISNTKSTGWSGQFFPKQGHEKLWAGTWRVNGQDYTGQDSFSIVVPAYTTIKVVLTGDDAVPVQSGYLFMWGTGASSAYDVSISYFYEYYMDGKLAMSNGSIEGAPHTTFYFPLEHSATASAGVNTGIAWAPEFSTTPNNGFNMTATLYLTDKTGIGQPYASKTFPYSGHAAQFITDIFPELKGTDFKGFLKLAAQYNVFLEVLRIDSTESGFLLTSTPPDFTTP